MSQSHEETGADRAHHDQVVEDHHRLMGHLQGLQKALEATPDWDTWLESIQTTLGVLAKELPEHFELEQTGELYRTLPAERPQFARRLAELEGQHPKILGALEKATGLAGSLRATRDGDLGALAESVRAFITTLRAHEAAESEIIAKAYWEDLGVGG